MGPPQRKTRKGRIDRGLRRARGDGRDRGKRPAHRELSQDDLSYFQKQRYQHLKGSTLVRHENGIYGQTQTGKKGRDHEGEVEGAEKNSGSLTEFLYQYQDSF